MRATILVLLLISSAALSFDAEAKVRCGDALGVPTPFELEMKRLVDVDLQDHHWNEVVNLTPEQVEALNQETFRDLDALRPRRGRIWTPASVARANQMIQSLNKNPVAGDDDRYSQPNVSIGYCFGRATEAHFGAIVAKHNRQQMKKIWVVGEMSTYVTWAFHVAFIIRDGAYGPWRVIDNLDSSKALPLEKWYAERMKTSVDKKLRVYITEPEKFTTSPGKYNRVQMGLVFPPEEDWYRGYFRDLNLARRGIYVRPASPARVVVPPPAPESGAPAAATSIQDDVLRIIHGLLNGILNPT